METQENFQPNKYLREILRRVQTLVYGYTDFAALGPGHIYLVRISQPGNPLFYLTRVRPLENETPCRYCGKPAGIEDALELLYGRFKIIGKSGKKVEVDPELRLFALHIKHLHENVAELD